MIEFTNKTTPTEQTKKAMPQIGQEKITEYMQRVSKGDPKAMESLQMDPKLMESLEIKRLIAAEHLRQYLFVFLSNFAKIKSIQSELSSNHKLIDLLKQSISNPFESGYVCYLSNQSTYQSINHSTFQSIN